MAINCPAKFPKRPELITNSNQEVKASQSKEAYLKEWAEFVKQNKRPN